MNNPNNPNNMNILFYSYKCQDCRSLLFLLKNENLLSYFKLICVDDKLDKLPQNMIVPTMIILNIPKPLVAHETFEWINQIKFIRQQQTINVNQNINQNNILTMNNKKGPIGFDEEIMSGISDKFAFTKIDNPLPHSYFNVGQEDKNAIFTAPQEQNKLSKNEQIKMINDLESRRSLQDSENQKLIKQKQMEAIMISEYEQS